MKLSRVEIIALIASFGAVLISAVIHIGIREWYKPDIRYETGSYYISGQVAIASLKVRNYGHSDAENVTVSTTFPSKLTDISLNRKDVKSTILSGGPGKHNTVLQLEYLVPEQTVYAYYAIEYDVNDPKNLPEHFLNEITYKGGKAKTGEPNWDTLIILTSFFIIYSLIIFVFRRKFFSMNFKKHYAQIGVIIAAAQKAIKENKDQDTFMQEISEHYKKEKFRRLTLLQVASHTYKTLKAKGEKVD